MIGKKGPGFVERTKRGYQRRENRGFIKATKEEYREGGILNVLKEKIRKHYLLLILTVALKIAKLYDYLKRSRTGI